MQPLTVDDLTVDELSRQIFGELETTRITDAVFRQSAFGPVESLSAKLHMPHWLSMAKKGGSLRSAAKQYRAEVHLPSSDVESAIFAKSIDEEWMQYSMQDGLQSVVDQMWYQLSKEKAVDFCFNTACTGLELRRCESGETEVLLI